MVNKISIKQIYILLIIYSILSCSSEQTEMISDEEYRVYITVLNYINQFQNIKYQQPSDIIISESTVIPIDVINYPELDLEELQLTQLYKKCYINMNHPDTINKNMPELIKLKLLNDSSLEGSIKERMIKYLDIDSIKDTTHEYIINDFILKNSNTYQIGQRLIENDEKCIIVSESLIDSLFSEEKANSDWSKFFQRYPNSTGILSFSRVGFSEQKTHAIVYIEKYCGFHCGTGSYLFLGNSKNGWKANSIFRIWEL